MKAKIKLSNTPRVYLAETPSYRGYDMLMEYVEELRQQACWELN